jgi:DNA-binding NtrC family response regulator
MARLLLVDDEPSILNVLSTLLRAEGYEVTTAAGGDKALEILANQDFDLMLSDIRMSPINGIELLRKVRETKPNMGVIMLTAYGTIETAVEALKLGAFDYITKPFKVDELLITVQRALDYRRAIMENIDLKAQLVAKYGLEGIVAESRVMQQVCEMVKKVAPTDTTVLIYGESGTGKELIARAIHKLSRRRDKRFLAINCAALPEPLLESEMFGHVKGAFTGAVSNKEGLFESAKGGTIFLDEIGSMPLSIQGKLLRALQEKEIRPVGSNETIPIDVRVLAATNTRLETLMSEGKFREDLYYRLNVISIELKPLRERPEDILPLTIHILRSQVPPGQPIPTLDPEVYAIFEAYSWPGNVRELENAIKHALTFAKEGKITKADLPPKIAAIEVPPKQPTTPLEEFKARSLRAFIKAKEKEYLKQVLAHTGGDKEKAAQALKISLATLYRKLPEDES